MNTPAPIERLVASGEKLSTSVRSQLLAARPAIVPELIALIEADLAHEPPDDTWATLHAAVLLGEIGDTRAVPVLIRCLAEGSGLMLLHEQAFKTLVGLGAAALDSCLETYTNSDNASLRYDMACVLSRLQIKDERIFNVLTETLSRNPVVGANALFDYGDPRALALLSKAFVRQPIEPSESLLDKHIFIELRAAFIDLGGQLTAAQADKYAQAMREPLAVWLQRIQKPLSNG